MSLSVIAAVGAAVVGGTGAFFSDSETSTGNTFTAGAIDLKVDSKQSYNGNVCQLGNFDNDINTPETYGWVGNAAYPVVGTACSGAWAVMKDLVPTVDKFFNFGDVKPGDSGSNSISLHVFNNDAYVCATVANLKNDDLGLTEPEQSAPANDNTNGVGNGELQQKMLVTIWKDTDGDNVLGGGETVLYGPAPAQAGTWPLYTPAMGALAGETTAWLGVKWELPLATGNEVQTDSLTADISFKVEQARNNPNFTCTQDVLVTGPQPVI